MAFTSISSGTENRKGKHIFPNGSIYEGDSVNDKYHGKGKLVLADGKIYELEILLISLFDYLVIATVKFVKIMNEPSRKQ